MIRPREDIVATDPASAAPSAPTATTAAAGTATGWDVESLPPELDYFRRSEAYQVELSGFQGPMDLLLYLIQKDEIDIHDIPISRITEQFIRHIEVMHAVALDQAGEFMAMAATLLVIKLKMLMPRQADLDEEPEEADPRAELVRRLLEYKRFKEAAQLLRVCEDQRAQYHVRQARYPFLDESEREPALRLEMFDLLSALAAVLDRVQAKTVHAVLREPFTVEEKIKLILAVVSEQATVRFEDCFRCDAIRMEVIVTFIAILELIKRGELAAFQTEPRGPIWLQARQVEPARVAEHEA
ncbi:MAG: segregation/condensation protein A [Candidatus Krumholzibacteria bacterium]|nr:segregation/condensation protein A [Candidatus Krumholzibacteria bacterium]